MRTSRIVIPRAYISVLFDGNSSRDHFVSPYLAGSRISGAIHRTASLVRRLLDHSTGVVSSTIAASPKSSKRARHSESIRMLTCISTPLVNAT